jgi:hypothetical protein
MHRQLPAVANHPNPLPVQPPFALLLATQHVPRVDSKGVLADAISLRGQPELRPEMVEAKSRVDLADPGIGHRRRESTAKKCIPTGAFQGTFGVAVAVFDDPSGSADGRPIVHGNQSGRHAGATTLPARDSVRNGEGGESVGTASEVDGGKGRRQHGGAIVVRPPGRFDVGKAGPSVARAVGPAERRSRTQHAGYRRRRHHRRKSMHRHGRPVRGHCADRRRYDERAAPQLKPRPWRKGVHISGIAVDPARQENEATPTHQALDLAVAQSGCAAVGRRQQPPRASSALSGSPRGVGGPAQSRVSWHTGTSTAKLLRMWTTPPLHSATADRAAELGRHGNLGTEVADFGRAGGDDSRGGGGAEEMISAAAEGPRR